MKRPLLIIAVCLLLGAMVNVAVAWGCAVWSPLAGVTIRGCEPGSNWPRPVPEGWPLPTWWQGRSGVGVDFESIAAVAVRPDHNELEDVYGIAIYKAGWPYHSLGAERRMAFTSMIYEWQQGYEWQGSINLRWLRSHNERPLPLKPIWPGFAINTIFYATLLWLLVRGSVALRRFLRVRRGLCPKCAYPMGESSVCTECGCELPKRVRTP